MGSWTHRPEVAGVCWGREQPKNLGRPELAVAVAVSVSAVPLRRLRPLESNPNETARPEVSLRSLRKPQIVETNREVIGVARGLNVFARSRVAINDDSDRRDFRAHLQQSLDCSERRTARCRRVFKHNHSLASKVGPFDLTTTAVVFRLLADNEGVIRVPQRDTLVQHCGSDRVGAHRETADCGDIRNFFNEVDHDLTDERGDPVVEAHSTQVNVIGGLLATREGEVTVKNRIASDVVDELGLGVFHPFTLWHGEPVEGLELLPLLLCV